MDMSQWKRQYGGDHDDDDDDDYHGGWWGYSPTATAIKWSVVGAIILILFIWLIGGYYHARRRVKRGQAPLMYHRFLLPRSQRARYAPQPPFTFYQQGYGEGGYPLHAYPPPAYNAEQPAPPVYQPAEGASKLNPSQTWTAPPPGPPPNHANAGESSSVMHNVPLTQGSSSQHNEDTRPHVQEAKAGFAARMNPFK